jgi:hypothetical protein
MTKQEMIQFIEKDHAVTYNSVRIDYKTNNFKIGFFVPFDDYQKLKESNKWRFVTNNSSVNYQATKSIDHSIIINGDDVLKLTAL